MYLLVNKRTNAVRTAVSVTLAVRGAVVASLTRIAGAVRAAFLYASVNDG